MKPILALVILLFPFIYLSEDEHGKAEEIVLPGIIRNCTGDTCWQKQIFPQQDRDTFVLHADEYGGFADTLVILRQDLRQKVKVQLPAGGSQTGFILEQEDNKGVKTNMDAIMEGGGGHDSGPFAVSLSNLPNGRYYLNYSSCNFWGSLTIELREK